MDAGLCQAQSVRGLFMPMLLTEAFFEHAKIMDPREIPNDYSSPPLNLEQKTGKNFVRGANKSKYRGIRCTRQQT
jgi:hypothetical protein